MSANVTMEWHGDDFMADVERTLPDALTAMSVIPLNKAKKNLSRRGATFATIRAGRAAIARSVRRGFARLADRTAINAARQEDQYGKVDPPGGFPRSRSGDLARDTSNGLVKVKGETAARISFNKEYAAIQEFGGTINHPGGTPYIIIGGQAVFISNEKAAEREGKGLYVKRTKPHTIHVPARPYLRPALKETRDEQLSEFVRIMQQGVLGGGV